MTIKIGSKIVKLDPADTYKLMDGEDVEGFTEVRQATQQNTRGVDALKEGQRVLESNISQKLSGVTVSDTAGNSFADITEIAFRGGIAQWVQGTTKVQVLIDPQFSVSNGAIPGVSQAVDARALRFIDATITPDPRDPKIAVVSFPAHSGGGSTVIARVPIVTDGAEYADYKKLKFEDFKVAVDAEGVLTLTAPANPGTGTAFDLILDNGTDNIGGVDTIELPTSKLTSKGTGTVELIPQITLRNGASDDAQYDTASKEIVFMPPLKTYADPNNADAGVVEIDHGAYEPQHAASFLAYLKDDVEVVGKIASPTGHHDGALWFDDVVVPNGPYIQLDRNLKTYGIQEYDDLDPNVTGGTPYLVAFRVAMKGKAANDGLVRAYLWNATTKDFVTDAGNNVLAVERSYKAGDTLGTLEVMGIIRAGGLMEFSCHVMDTFVDDTIVLEDRTEGASAIMIQTLSSQEKTGAALMQFEQDTAQRIVFSSHYLGPSRMSIQWILRSTMPVREGAARDGQTMTDGFHFFNISPMKMGVEDGQLLFTNNDKGDIVDFSFGKIFSAEETALLAGREVTFNGVLTANDCAFNVALVKWSGTPDAYTREIITSRNNGAPVYAANWSEVDKLFIPEDAINVDRQVSKAFTVPKDAANYGIIIYPVTAQDPMTLRIKGFSADVTQPFTGYFLKAPELLAERHLYRSKEFAKVAMTCPPGYAALRYTINATPADGLPMPVGVLRKGDLAVTTDMSVNRVSGFAGEGVLKFDDEGRAQIQTTLRLYAGEAVPAGTTATVDFWYSQVDPDDKRFTEIVGSRTQFTVTGGSKVPQSARMTPFVIDIEKGERIALFAKASVKDGAYLQAPASSSLVDTVINIAALKS